ncbi:MAG: LVIVD repeat-containing protein, partial [Burkholderiales bacterium]
VYIYVSGSAPVRSPNELAGCALGSPDTAPTTALFRIEVIQVPLAHPEQARIVSSPRIFQDLVAPARHAEAPEDIAEAKRQADSARAAGGFVVTFEGDDRILGTGFTTWALDSIVKARGDTGKPTAADTATLRANLETIFTQRVEANRRRSGIGPRSGPTQCHDITAYPAIGLAGGACAGYGLLLDIRDVANPKRVSAAADSNFSFWHSATFNNDGSKILFTDEWGGGLQPRCRSTDKPEWGANAIFTLSGTDMTFKSYYKLPVPQTAFENCVAHNGTLIPVPGRDVMVQGWYQGGVSVFDWTDPAHPKEIAFFDRGPMDSTKLVGAGSWSAYWYNGYIISSEIARGLDIFELTPNTLLTQNEIDAAKLIRFDYLNAQDQQKLVWPASFVVARAYLDQLARSKGLPTKRLNGARDALSRAEQAAGQARTTALSQLATQLTTEARTSTDQAKMQLLIGVVTELGK